jgi:hypothetical protein
MSTPVIPIAETQAQVAQAQVGQAQVAQAPAPPSLFSQLQSSFSNNTAPKKMTYNTLRLLTVFPPTGALGLNYVALNNPIVAAIKAASTLVVTFFIRYLLQFHPPIIQESIIWFSGILSFWYLFDICEIMRSKEEFVKGINTGFKDELGKDIFKNGFRLPFNINITELNTPCVDKDASWLLTSSLISLIVATLSSAGFLIMNYIPAGLIPANVLQTINYATGGTTMASILFSFILNSNTPPVVNSCNPPSEMLQPPIAKGGGLPPLSSFSKQVGGGLPPLSSFADKLLTSKSSDESYAFFSVIGIVLLGGFFIGWSKKYTV